MELSAQRIGKKIKEFRKEKNLTQLKFGEKIGKSESTIRKYESGSVQPSLQILKDISDKFNVDVKFFLTINDDELTDYERQQLNSFEMSQVNMIDTHFSDLKDLLDILIQTNLFEKEFEFNCNTINSNEIKSFKNDLYSCIEYNCFKFKKKAQDNKDKK